MRRKTYPLDTKTPDLLGAFQLVPVVDPLQKKTIKPSSSTIGRGISHFDEGSLLIGKNNLEHFRSRLRSFLNDRLHNRSIAPLAPFTDLDDSEPTRILKSSGCQRLGLSQKVLAAVRVAEE